MNKLLLVLLPLIIGSLFIPVSNAEIVTITDNMEVTPYIGSLWDAFIKAGGDAQSTTYAHSGTKSFKVVNATKWTYTFSNDTTAVSMTLWARFLPGATNISITDDNHIEYNVYCEQGNLETLIASFPGGDEELLPYNYTSYPWVKIQFIYGGGVARGIIGGKTTSINSPELGDELAISVNSNASLYIDDISVTSQSSLSGSPLVNGLIPLIGVMGLLGIGLPLLASTGGTPAQKAIKILVYLIVVGSLIGYAFGWFVPFSNPPI